MKYISTPFLKKVVIAECVIVILLALVTGGPSLYASVYIQWGFKSLLKMQLIGDEHSLDVAKVNLLDAVQQFPSDVRVHRGLAKVFEAEDNFADAESELLTANRLDPENTVVNRELGILYDAFSQPAKANVFWMHSGISAKWAETRGDDFWNAENYKDSLIWYIRSYLLKPKLDDSIVLRMAMAAVMSGDKDSAVYVQKAQQVGEIEHVKVLYRSLVINGGELRWITDFPEFNVLAGTLLSFPYESSVGIFWWNGQAAELIEVAETAPYLLSVRIGSSGPPPIKIAIGVDGKPLHYITLAEDAIAPYTETFLTNLRLGFHTINIWFLNNETLNGQDRNAIIEEITIHRAR